MRNTNELSSAFDALVARLSQWQETVRGRRAVPESDVTELLDSLKSYSFEEPRSLPALVEDIADMMERWTVHTTHPRYFGLFNANVHHASIVADAMVAGYNPQVGLWSHSPAANEIERYVLSHFSKAFGFDPQTSAAHFTTGGSEANFSAIAAALTRAFPQVAEDGVGALPGQPVFYVSQEAHHSVEKSAHLLGLGRSAVHWVKTDGAFCMIPEALREAIQMDRAAGREPFLVVGTAGTTSLGSVDPLPEVGAVARQEDLWFHVDAAWGGGAILSPKLRPFLRGIESADSITCDAHKWLSVSMGAGMLFCKDPQSLVAAFGVNAPYVSGSIRENLEPFTTTLQWSRRFIGLKLFMTMAHLGEQGVIDAIEHQAAMGECLCASLVEHGWKVLTKSPFPLACFTHPLIQAGTVTTSSFVERIYGRGQVWISESTVPSGEAVLRACICNYQTDVDDIARLQQELNHCLTPES